MIEFKVLTRRGCHLCEDLLEQLQPLVRDAATIVLVDIDGDAAFRARYHADIPVVMVGEREICRHFLDIDRVLQILATNA